MDYLTKRRFALISQQDDKFFRGNKLKWETGLALSSTGVVDPQYYQYMTTTNYIPCKKNKELQYLGPQYYDLEKEIQYGVYISQYKSNKSFISRRYLQSPTSINRAIQINENCAYIKISFGYSTNITTEEPMSIEKTAECLISKTNTSRIHGTWDDLFYAIDNNSYTTDYDLGELILIDLGTGGKLDMQIVGFNLDTYEENTNKVPVSFISKQLYKTGHRMNPALNPSSAPYDEGTGTIGGWGKSEMRTYLQETIFPLIPENVRNRIVNVKKYSYIYTTSATAYKNDLSYDKIWIPSCREVGISQESSGPTYSGIFTGNAARKKTLYENTTVRQYCLRTAYFSFSHQSFYSVAISGAANTAKATSSSYFPIGFCIG